MLAEQKVKKFTELLSCAFTVYDCRQLEDASSVKNVQGLQKSYLKFLSGDVSPPSFIIKSVMPPLYMTSYLMFTRRPFSFQ